MPEHRRFTQTTSLEERLAKEATRLRKQAQGTHRALSATSCFAKPTEPRQLQHMTERLASGDKHQDKF